MQIAKGAGSTRVLYHSTDKKLYQDLSRISAWFALFFPLK
jgi:hypothetical protein